MEVMYRINIQGSALTTEVHRVRPYVSLVSSVVNAEISINKASARSGNEFSRGLFCAELTGLIISRNGPGGNVQAIPAIDTHDGQCKI